MAVLWKRSTIKLLKMKKRPPSHCMFDLSLPMEPSTGMCLSLMSYNSQGISSIQNLPASLFCFHPKVRSNFLNLCVQSGSFYHGGNS